MSPGATYTTTRHSSLDISSTTRILHLPDPRHVADLLRVTLVFRSRMLHGGVVTSTDPIPPAVQRALLVSRVRSVMFAALGAGVSEAELRAAVDSAVAGHARRDATPRLRVVPTPGPG